ncbi:transcriptional regulator [Serratia sp. Leaf51]|nr:transcriptional regulator [Serratia sp. Leaf51]
MASLTKKQTAQLSEMSHEVLLNIIHDLIQDNKHARTTLVNGYLISASEVLKAVEKEYARRSKSKRFYDYHDADTFFDELTRSIANPLVGIAHELPEQAESLSVKMMLEFEKFTGNVDTSNGSWMGYYTILVNAWMKSLEAQKNRPPFFIAQKIFTVVEREFYFGIEIFKRYCTLLGMDILRAIRDMYYKKKRHREALGLSVIIQDLDFMKMAFKNDEFCHATHYFDYARLLMEDLRADEALAVLKSQRDDDGEITDNVIWNELFIQALIEEGRKKEAKAHCITAFTFQCDTRFYHLYTKAGEKDVDHSPVFLNIANDMVLAPYVCFASDIERYDLIDACIIATPKANFADSLAYITHSFLRTLSSTLYKHGYALTATLLRRFLVEDNIQQSKSKYYSYAASDMKKAIDYGEGREDSVQLPGAQAYLNVLYEQHKRKTALWPLMTDKIKGLSVGKDGVHYNGGVS